MLLFLCFKVSAHETEISRTMCFSSVCVTAERDSFDGEYIILTTQLKCIELFIFIQYIMTFVRISLTEMFKCVLD